MRARILVFPIKGRNWCFSRSIDKSTSDSQSSSKIPTTFKQLWNTINSSSDKSPAANAEILVDFAANKMNKSWTSLEMAPAGSFKSKIHGLGVRLLSRVKPSEIFLKSISNEITDVEVIYPPSLNERLVRRRLRHIALSLLEIGCKQAKLRRHIFHCLAHFVDEPCFIFRKCRGTVIHKNYFYGSVTLLPFTSAFMILPLPNVPFFWTLFRTYSHWRALKGSEKLLQLVSDCIQNQSPSNEVDNGGKRAEDNSNNEIQNPCGPQWVLRPSKELEELLQSGGGADGPSEELISEICKAFDLNKLDVLKYQHML